MTKFDPAFEQAAIDYVTARELFQRSDAAVREYCHMNPMLDRDGALLMQHRDEAMEAVGITWAALKLMFHRHVAKLTASPAPAEPEDYGSADLAGCGPDDD